MIDRTDPMYFDIEIEEVKTKKATKSLVACWWSGDASADGLRRMCDCQLAGYFYAKPHKTQEGMNWSNAFTIAQSEYLKTNKCDHSKPARRFAAIKAHLPSGQVVKIAA